MKYVRLIPRLDIKGPNLVKGIHLEGLRVMGKPERFARYYYECGADELIYIDIVASLYERNSLLEIVQRTAREIFIPLTVGGGLRTLEDIRTVLRAGADKVAINTAAIRNPELIKDAARKFGSSTIVVSVEAIQQQDGGYLAYIDNGREYTGIDVFQWVQQAEKMGAGEILLTSVDREGTGKGFDIPLTRQVADTVGIPVIACGGAGQLDHILDVAQEGHADAIGLASVLHYDFLNQGTHDQDFFQEGNIEYLMSGRKFSKINPLNLQGVKEFLIKQGIPCRQGNFEACSHG